VRKENLYEKKTLPPLSITHFLVTFLDRARETRACQEGSLGTSNNLEVETKQSLANASFLPFLHFPLLLVLLFVTLTTSRHRSVCEGSQDLITCLALEAEEEREYTA